ncbi:MAG: AzlD domain-containing protein [Mycobacteriales bacterium]
MTFLAVLAASACVFAIKYAGHLAPESVFSDSRIARVIVLLPAALLAALVVVQTVTTADRLVVDARLVGLGAAAVALLLRAPFIVVVAVAASAAAGVRALGWG